MRIFESVCGRCGAEDSLVPLKDEEGVWRCRNCDEEFEECDGT